LVGTLLALNPDYYPAVHFLTFASAFVLAFVTMTKAETLKLALVGNSAPNPYRPWTLLVLKV
jgi:hypothetical protein